MMAKKKRLTLMIGLPIVLVLIIIGLLIILYLNTDMFKSSQTLFEKYIGKNVENLDMIEKMFEETEFEKTLDTNPYEKVSDIKVNYTKNIGTTSENTNNGINKASVKTEEKIDKSNQYNYKNIKLIGNNEDKMQIEYLQNKDIFGIKFSDLFNQYLAIENNNLKELFEKIGYSKEKLENIPDKIEIDNSLFNYDEFKFTDEEINILKQKYLELIIKEIPKGNFSKQNKQIISIDEKDIVVNSYTMNLTKEQLNNIYIKILEKIKEDEIIQNKIQYIENKLKNISLASNDSINLKEDFVINIDKKIYEINKNNIGNEETNIVVYESEGDTRTVIKGDGYQVQFDCMQIGEEKFVEASYMEKQDEIMKIALKSNKEQMKIIVNGKENNNVFDFSIEQNKNINNSQSETIKNNIKYDFNQNRIEVNIKEEIKIVDNFQEKVEFNEENKVQLNELNKESLSAIVDRVSQALTNKINEIGEVFGKKDIEEILKSLSIIKEDGTLEETGVTEVEKNRFNSKFEFLQGEKIKGEDVAIMVDSIKDNLIAMEVVSGQELKLEISSTKKDENISKKLKTFLEKEKDKEYNIKIEYDETGIVKYIVLDIYKKD